MTTSVITEGLVATTPRIVEYEGKEIVSFRLADSLESMTNWFTISGFGEMADKMKSIGKGDRLVVSGELLVRDWDNGERSGTSVEIEAVSFYVSRKSSA